MKHKQNSNQFDYRHPKKVFFNIPNILADWADRLNKLRGASFGSNFVTVVLLYSAIFSAKT